MIIHNGVNSNLDTRFGIASLTKTFTSILVIQLSEKGLIDLDNPIKTYLTDLVIERKELDSPPVTIRHLLSHNSGMPGYGQNVKATINSKTIYLKKQKYPAGYNYSYSNKGNIILKHLIETVTGISYAENLK